MDVNLIVVAPLTQQPPQRLDRRRLSRHQITVTERLNRFCFRSLNKLKIKTSRFMVWVKAHQLVARRGKNPTSVVCMESRELIGKESGPPWEANTFRTVSHDHKLAKPKSCRFRGPQESSDGISLSLWCQVSVRKTEPWEEMPSCSLLLALSRPCFASYEALFWPYSSGHTGWHCRVLQKNFFYFAGLQKISVWCNKVCDSIGRVGHRSRFEEMGFLKPGFQESST